MRELKVGESWVRFEPPDTLVKGIVGQLSVSEARAILAAADRLTEGAADLYILGDISRMGSIPADVRRLVREFRPSPKIRAMAVVGPISHERTLAMLLLKAFSIVWKQANVFQFFDTEEQARAWFAEIRRARAQREAASGA